MQDSEFAATMRQLTGKESNSEALAVLRGGAPPTFTEPLTAEKIGADVVAVADAIAVTKERVVSYFRRRWDELTEQNGSTDLLTTDDAVQVVEDGFTLGESDEPEVVSSMQAPVGLAESGSEVAREDDTHASGTE